jgi:hypothetical protein
MPITSAPCAFAIATAGEPTPPAAPVTAMRRLPRSPILCGVERSYARQTQRYHLKRINVSGKAAIALAGTATYSGYPPGLCGPSPCIIVITRSPTRTPETFAPTSTPSPTTSSPGV